MSNDREDYFFLIIPSHFFDIGKMTQIKKKKKKHPFQ